MYKNKVVFVTGANIIVDGGMTKKWYMLNNHIYKNTSIIKSKLEVLLKKTSTSVVTIMWNIYTSDKI